MATNHSFKLKRILFGNLAADGGMSTTLTEKFGETVLGTARFGGEDTTTTNFFVEEHDDAVESISVAGVLSFTFSTHNASQTAFLNAFGGTIVAGVYHAPDSEQDIEQSIRAELQTGLFFEFTRVKVKARPSLTMAKDTIGQIDFTCTILKPSKTGESKWRSGQVA